MGEMAGADKAKVGALVSVPLFSSLTLAQLEQLAGALKQRDAVVKDAQALVQACECAHGCPSCIGPILASDEVRGYSPKQVALRVLGLLSNRAGDAATSLGVEDTPVKTELGQG